jgi:hypothetical protein
MITKIKHRIITENNSAASVCCCPLVELPASVEGVDECRERGFVSTSKLFPKFIFLSTLYVFSGAAAIMSIII